MRINGVEVRKGAKVWSPIFGWGVVRGVRYDKIIVDFKATAGTIAVQTNKAPGGNQYLYWDELDMTPPPRQKPMVKRYLVLYKSGETPEFRVSGQYYRDRKEFEEKVRFVTFIHLIKDSEKEFEDG